MIGAITAVVAVILVILDQVIKHLVFVNLRPVDVVEFIPGFMQFRYVENTGAAFGMLNDKIIFLIAITVVVIGLGFYILLSNKLTDRYQYIGAVLILSGGIGNLIDRIFRKFVIDFIEFTFVDFAVFNFADCLITIGAVFLVFSLIKELVRESKSNSIKEKNNA